MTSTPQPTLRQILDALPESLRERSRPLNLSFNERTGRSLNEQTGKPQLAGDFVLYWMRTAVRIDENPALDTAIAIANELQLPVLVYHALSERYPYASDRHHTFILEGARDVQNSIADRQVGYAFHLERRGHRGPHLKVLGNRAAAVVTEEMPVRPLDLWTDRLARQITSPMVCVDTACVVPMRLVGQAYERAFAYRKATSQLYAARIGRTSDPLTPRVAAETIEDLPFEPLDLQSVDLDELVAACDIDHFIGPVPHTTGGSIAGYQRWESFKESGLARYDRARNNPLVDGVSRMSPYLHYGMVSPMRLAREASESKLRGAEKYLDELLIWRELAYSFCFYRSDRDRLSALPSWAVKTLEEHRSDDRPALLPWESLARGVSGDALWDAAQRSLLMQGELHNNVRMTWGKAILKWTPDAGDALKMLIDLNHRYALDGRDPASYGGILWCLGQFDRPFSPPREILGTVRDRTTTQHANRLDVDAYLKKSTRPLFDPLPRVAVIGAGLSGLTCARTLTDHGCRVTVFEKSRGVAGRMATRRAADNLCFDHGAQYFTIRDQRFRRYVKSWIDSGLVARWEGRIAVIREGQITGYKDNRERYVGVPGMNAVGKHLATDLDVRLETTVAPVEPRRDFWSLKSDSGSPLGEFDALVISAPAGQTAALISSNPRLAQAAEQVKMSGCWALMCTVENRLSLECDGAFVHDSPLTWMARNSSKPSRPSEPECWVLHASPEWSEANAGRSADEVANDLLEEFAKLGGFPIQEVVFQTAHFWRYALPPEPLADACLFDPETWSGVCGDWCGGPRVEGAFLSGMALAGRLLGRFAQHARRQQTEPLSQGVLF